MAETSATKYIDRKRSCTFGAYESIIRGVDGLSHGENLTTSAIRSTFSGVGISCGGRPRSSTWNGAVVQTKQVQQELTTSLSVWLKSASSSSPPYSKDIFDDIITKELWNHLGGNCDSIHGPQEFIKKSSIISKAIGKKASQMVDNKTKIIASVYIGEILDDGIEVASQCLLDPALDAFGSGNFTNSRIFAVGTLFVASYMSS